MADLFANNYSTQLAVGCTAGDTSLTLTGTVPSALQAGGQWRAMFSNGEIVIIPGGQAGPTVTGVTRGAETSLAAPAATVHQQGEWLTHTATAGALGGLVGAAAFGGTVVASPSGDTTGATDTTVIHAARTAAGVGGTLLLQNGTYWTTGLNANVAGQNWKLPAGCTIEIANAVNAPVITVTGANTILEGPGIIDGNQANTSGGGNVGIWTNVGSAGSTVRNLTVQNTHGLGILNYVAPVTIQGNTFLNTGAGAIFTQPGTVADMPDIRVVDNLIDKSAQNPATATGYGIQLHGGPNAVTFTATATSGSPTLATVSSFTNLAVGNAITGTNAATGATIKSLNPGASTLDMTLPAIGSGSFTVSVQYALRGLVVSRNKVLLPLSPTNTMIGIECWGWTPGAMVAQNRLSGGTMGISLDRSDNGTVATNSSENYVSQGIEAANCINVTITGNVCDGSVRGGGGITLDGLVTPSAKCTITGNTLVRITNVGASAGKAIFVITNGDHTTITGNVVNVPVGVNVTGIYIQNSPSTSVTGNVLTCASAASFNAITFEGSASGGAVVVGNLIEGWPNSAVALFAGTVQTLDRIIIGPNILNGNGTILKLVGSAVMGASCRYVNAEQGIAPPGAAAITVTASPFTYTNTDSVPEMVYVSGGTVSAVAKNSITVFATTNVGVLLEPSEAVTVTYSVLPTMNKDRK